MRDNRSPEDRRESTIRRFFAGLAEFAFESRLGVADPPLVDYVSELLERFIRSDDIYSVRSNRGQRLTHVADMIEEAAQRKGPARRRVHRHIGDFTLFWTGVYPEVADRIRKSSGKDSLLNYQDQGKRNYFAASQIPVDSEQAPSDVLERLSDQFDLCVYGLSEVRRLWNERDPQGDGGLPLLL